MEPRNRFGQLAVGTLLLGGCLSLDSVEVHDNLDASPDDAESASESDANAADGDAGAPPCFDRGTYAVEEVTRWLAYGIEGNPDDQVVHFVPTAN